MNPSQDAPDSGASSGCPPPSCSDSSFMGAGVAQIMEDLDGILGPTGYARCSEIEGYAETHNGDRLFVMDFGHFRIDVLVSRKHPKPRAIAFAMDDCSSDDFLRKLRENPRPHHRPHEGRPTIHQEFTKHARGIREGFKCLGDDKPLPHRITLAE